MSIHIDANRPQAALAGGDQDIAGEKALATPPLAPTHHDDPTASIVSAIFSYRRHFSPVILLACAK
ncbi:MAG TPA: hypothetical protein VMI52_05250 [Acetobacteraceae bacterium]|nr:hypothetical protein [Acetobacteraceae bacterium]